MECRNCAHHLAINIYSIRITIFEHHSTRVLRVDDAQIGSAAIASTTRDPTGDTITLLLTAALGRLAHFINYLDVGCINDSGIAYSLTRLHCLRGDSDGWRGRGSFLGLFGNFRLIGAEHFTTQAEDALFHTAVGAESRLATLNLIAKLTRTTRVAEALTAITDAHTGAGWTLG